MEENPMLKVQKETEAAVASAKAETRARRKWAYVRENVLLAWAKRKGIQIPIVEGGALAITDDIIRQFFEKDIEDAGAVVEKSTDPELAASFAVWTGKSRPGYVREAELRAWIDSNTPSTPSFPGGMPEATPSDDEAVLAFFGLQDDESAAVTKLEDGRGVFFAVRSTRRAPELPAFYVAMTEVASTEPAPPPAAVAGITSDEET